MLDIQKEDACLIIILRKTVTRRQTVDVLLIHVHVQPIVNTERLWLDYTIRYCNVSLNLVQHKHQCVHPSITMTIASKSSAMCEHRTLNILQQNPNKCRTSDFDLMLTTTDASSTGT